MYIELSFVTKAYFKLFCLSFGFTAYLSSFLLLLIELFLILLGPLLPRCCKPCEEDDKENAARARSGIGVRTYIFKVESRSERLR